MKVNFITVSDEHKQLLLQKLIEDFQSKIISNVSTLEFKLDINKDVSAENYIKENNITAPRLLITADAYAKLRFFVDEHTTECAWHGVVEHHPDVNTYVITDILIYPQHVAGVTVESVDGEYEQWLMNLPENVFNNLRMQGHSHVNMGSTPSGVDESYYNDLLTQVQDYYIVMITNKNRSNHIRLYDKVNNICWTDLDLQICFENGMIVKEWLDTNEVQLKKKTYTTLVTEEKKETVTNTKAKEKEDYLDAAIEREAGKHLLIDFEEGTDQKHLLRPDNTLLSFANTKDMADYLLSMYKNTLYSLTKRKYKRSEMLDLLDNKILQFVSVNSTERTVRTHYSSATLTQEVYKTSDIWEIVSDSEFILYSSTGENRDKDFFKSEPEEESFSRVLAAYEENKRKGVYF